MVVIVIADIATAAARLHELLEYAVDRYVPLLQGVDKLLSRDGAALVHVDVLEGLARVRVRVRAWQG